MMLHIGLDGSRIAKPRYTGTEHYSHAIFEHLFRVAPHHHYTIYAPRRPTQPLDTGGATVSWRIMPFPRLWTQVRLSLEFATRPQPDVLFIPSHTIPLVHPAKTVVTVHDLGFRHFPAYYGRLERLYQEFGLSRAVKGATHIIAVSEATRDDLVRFTGYPKERITIVHHGVDREQFRPPSIGEQPSAAIKAVQPYLYSIGRLEAKKNTAQLLRAFRILKERHEVPHQLVLAGSPGQHGMAEIEATLASLPPKIRRSVHLLGYLPDADHARWLRFADCLVFPSGFEGFGMPALEAMASEVPVVASRSSSLPEIVGDAGIQVNETRAEAIAEGVLQVTSDPKERAALVTKGKERVKRFTWERAARTTIAVLEAVAGGQNAA